MNILNVLSPWIKLLIGSLLAISYDFFHVSYNSFIVIFIVIEVVMILFDFLLYLKIKRKISKDIVIYIFYNYMFIRMIYYFPK